MDHIQHINPDTLTLEDIKSVIDQHKKLQLSAVSKKYITDCRKFLEKKIKENDSLYYGINTGFGALCNVRISEKDIAGLQKNLVLSHAAGAGEEVPKEIVRLMLLLKIHALALGHSGVTLDLEERLIKFYNEEMTPVVYQQGSLGASGDLAPLAHLSLPLIGKGEIYFSGKKQKTAAALKKGQLKPLTLKAKEGLALLNGTQFMTAYGVWCLVKANRLISWAERIAALSIDAFDALTDVFLPHTHRLRPHAGQRITAERILNILRDSDIGKQKKTQVQDPYSFRCIPQVHGATRDTYEFVKKVIETEINSVTDNPILFPEEDLILNGGNFHGQPVALALDYLAIAMAEIGSISERRIFLLLSGQRGLPPFLTKEAGLNSGLMIAQYTAASIVSQNRQLCTPASVDSITSSNGQEDQVSMGANAATKLYKVVNNVETILAIELLCAVQALDFRKPLKTSPVLEKMIIEYRKMISFRKQDREVYLDIEKSKRFIEK